MRASRLLSVLLLLQNRGRMTAHQLAKELEVSVRTVYRDVESLCAAGVPVYAERGPDGGYRLVDGYRTRLTGLTPDEAESLFLSGMPAAAAELGLGTVLATAQLKLMAALPPELGSRAGRIAERFHLDAPGWFAELEQTPFLAAIADAVWRERRIRIRYRRWGPAEVVRELAPLGLVLKAGVWYLVAIADPADPTDPTGPTEPGADSSGPTEPRTYRVSRVLALEDLAAAGDPVRRPAGFDLAAFWEARSQQLRESLFRAEAVIRLSVDGMRRLPLVLGRLEAAAVADSAGEPDEHGWVRAVLPIESIMHAESSLLRLGADVEVLEPAELRRRISATVDRLAAIYRR